MNNFLFCSVFVLGVNENTRAVDLPRAACHVV